MPVPFKPGASSDWYRTHYLERGLGCREISKILGISRDKVRKDLRRAGIPLRPQVRWPGLRRDYFDVIDTPAKAYILGLISADGTLDPSTQQLRLRLAIEDRELLERVREELNGPRLTTLAPARPGRQPMALLCLSSKQIVDALLRLGISKRKDYELGPVAEVRKGLVRHFVRGLVDGDGCLKFTGGGRSPRIEFTNRNRHLLDIVRACWEGAGARVNEYNWKGLYPTIYCDAKGSVAAASLLYLRRPTALAMTRKVAMAREFAARGRRR